METLWQDLRYGLRMLIKNPGLTFVAVLSLSLGIGANSAIFSLVDALLLRPLPVEKPEQLVALTTSDYHGTYPHGLSYPDFVDYRDHAEAFSGVTAYSPLPLNLRSGDQNERVWGVMASGNYFDVLGVRAVVGRTFLPEEDKTAGTHPVVVVSYSFWQRKMGSDPNLSGKTLVINGHNFNVIGVAPKSFNGLEVIFSPDVWLTTSMHNEAVPGSLNFLEQRDAHDLRVWARLKPSVSFQQAQASIDIQAQQLESAYPATNKGVKIGLYKEWEARFEAGTGKVLAIGSGMLMAVVGFVLLIACANAANLLLSRVTARRREIAIRISLGAGRKRLVRQLLTEGLLISILGGCVATLFAFWATDILASLHPPGDIPLGLDIRLDKRVLLFTGLTALSTVLLFGLVPALQASKTELVTALKGEEITAGQKGSRFTLKNLLVIAQVSMSLVLLICAGLFLKSLRSAQAMDLGMRRDNVLLASVDLDLQGYETSKGKIFYRDLIERLRVLPGVESASLVRHVPLDFSDSNYDVVIEERQTTAEQEKVGILTSVVGLDYFKTIGTPLLQGRDFTPQDDEFRPGVVIINETMARTYWPGQNPIGKRFRLDSRDGRQLEVIGVAKDGKYRAYFEDPKKYMYLPFLQNYRGGMTLVVSSNQNPLGILSSIKQEMARMDPNLPVFGVKTMEEHIAGRTFAGPRLATFLLTIFGLLGLLLSAVGLYGVMSYYVTQRTREIGIRMALGAKPTDVLKMVVGQGMALTLVGLVIGLASAFLLTRLMSTLLFGVSATDPVTFTLISLILAAVALIASYIPARKAVKVDPMIALRYE